jgi:hypothetical protein
MPPPALRPLSLGEVLDISFGLYRSRFAPLFVVSVVCQMLPALIMVYLSSTGDALGNWVLLLAYYTLAIILSSLGVAASTFIVSDAYLGQQISAGNALGRATALLGRLIMISILSSMLIALGFILLIVPGVVLFAGLILSTVVTVLESPASATAAMGRSWELTKGFRGKVLITTMGAFILLLVPSFAVEAIWSLLGSFAGDSGGVAKLVTSSLLSMLIYPFFYVVLTVLYYDLRVRKEGFDLEVLASSLATG